MAMQARKIFPTLLVAAAVAIPAACSRMGGDVYMNSVEGSWQKESAQVFNFEIKDAQQPKNIIFVVRNNEDYPYSNLRVFSVLTKEGGKAATPDTLNFILAKPNGEWVGSGFGTVKETLFQYRTNYRFPESGRYRLEVRQAMRRDTLPGIEDFGVMIENTKP